MHLFILFHKYLFFWEGCESLIWNYCLSWPTEDPTKGGTNRKVTLLRDTTHDKVGTPHYLKKKMSEVTNHGISIGLIFLQLHVILIAIPHRITILCISICFHSCLSDKRLGQLILNKHVVNNIFHVPKVLASLDAFFFFR